MYNIIILIIAVLFVGSNNCSVIPTENDGELLGVAVYFRHGDRTPEKSFPTDEYFKIENFPVGFGQMTNNGINRHYELGKWLRKRYSGFLPDQYSPGDILVRSTDVDRTLMSAAANLAGLYPPEGDLVWNSNLRWRPIPIHTVKKTEDAVLAMREDCPKSDKLYEEVKQSDFYKKIDEEHAELYKYIADNSGLEVVGIEQIRLIRSVFYCYKNINASYIPKWAESLNQTELDYLSALAYQRHSASDELKSLRAGPFFKSLVDHFKNVSDAREDTPKFLMFSSHDTELVTVLDAMRVYDFYPPNFASMVIWEMKKNAKGDIYMNVYYRKSDDELIEKVIPGCKFNCPFKVFKELLKPVTVKKKEWKKQCSVTDDGDDNIDDGVDDYDNSDDDGDEDDVKY